VAVRTTAAGAHAWAENRYSHARNLNIYSHVHLRA
jgi:hypothetical protein